MTVGIRTAAANFRARVPFGTTEALAGSPPAHPLASANHDNDHNFPEIDCVRQHIPSDVIAAAEKRAMDIGVGADRVLITSGTLDEESYLRTLAATLGVTFETLEDVPRAQCPIEDDRLIDSIAAGLLPLMIDGALQIVLAPRGTAARRIVRLVSDNPAWAERFRFTTSERLTHFVLRCAGTALTVRARDKLLQNAPQFSAAARYRGGGLAPVAVFVLAMLTVILTPAVSTLIVEIALAALFLAWLGLRLIGAIIERPSVSPLPRETDESLPVYTIIAALYREEASVPSLLQAIAQLDYPPEKLDVILAVEADDHQTREAIGKCQQQLPITVISVPATDPRTKPKALNAALPFARGTFTVIYDAEDRPEPDQLRRALQAFRAEGEGLGCVQARLSVDNTADSYLTRLFTAEYAAQFDVFLDCLVQLQLPLPLGGSSNHFHTAVLRQLGAWDPYNVTEDADLGMRLARFGYRAAMIDSTTYEEAPAHLGPWLRQRTRWFKGWMQTWMVHMRQPIRLMQELRPAGFLAFQLVVGGNVLAALVHPLFLFGLAYAVTRGIPPWMAADSIAVAALAVLYGVNALVGYLTSALLGFIGLRRRGLLSTAWILLLTPLNWLLLSVAAWRALYQLAAAPYRWEKTEHGLARSSRRAASEAHALVEIERHLRRLKQARDSDSRARPATTARAAAYRRRTGETVRRGGPAFFGGAGDFSLAAGSSGSE